MAAASVLPAGVPSRCAPAHGRAGGGLLLALLPYRSQRCAQRAAGPLRLRRGWAFRCLMTSGGCGGSVVAAATGRSP